MGTAISPAFAETGLVPGSAATCRVSAFANALYGEPSTPASAIPATVPGAPTLNAVTGKHQRLEADIAPPADTGGLPLLNYEISLDGGPWTARTPPSTLSPVTVEGLANGTPYEVRLRAFNAAGPGAPSLPLTATPRPLSAAGGQEVKDVGPWRYRVFTGSGPFTPDDVGTVEALLVAAGGGGHFSGGGAGGLTRWVSVPVAAAPCSVVVGQRGAFNGESGGDSVLACGGQPLVAVGGGSGGVGHGAPGGSGGGHLR
ncbi:MAG: fibronectin type III domain-containing protein, partial [Deltaproteobacteria bacterium]|nr:fibronectin type III domain-containing protein [Deltaproteobacteria bacterium]